MFSQFRLSTEKGTGEEGVEGVNIDKEVNGGIKTRP